MSAQPIIGAAVYPGQTGYRPYYDFGLQAATGYVINGFGEAHEVRANDK